ncbi:Mov34/MPN/PAD-1 family protein [Mitsuaria sp. 7]|uniref:Mov34/MPN/PAD-1 family protein n=1 Tax=Mitsuaria sp. 7 TaxID=1658665 RepID=UPI000832D9A9|nr:Mov34/MPN/PAD-1 family protein [Mitsuaria sp. 7]
MIEVVLNSRCVRKLKRELAAAGPREIGGVLAAEQTADGRFLVLDLSVQRDGTTSSFQRDPAQHRAFIEEFHEKRGHQPQRFNYLGEWHSHPSFSATPSPEDFAQMQSLVEEDDQKSTFLVLLVVKLGLDGKLRGSVHGFRPGQQPVRGRLTSVDEGAVEEEQAPVILILITAKEDHEAD